MVFPPPLLVQLSEPSRRIVALPSLRVGEDGLLRRARVATPIVDELLTQAIEPKAQLRSALETIVTRGHPDEPDPLVRAGREDKSALGLCLSTVVTKAQLDNPDPWGVRRSSRSSDYLSTVITEHGFDQPDPNRTRRGSSRRSMT
jgi:hypothetical protein